MHSRLLLAIPEQKRQQKIFEDFTASLTEKGELENKWTQMILDWEKDPTKTNPYLSVVAREFNIFLTMRFLTPAPRCLSGRGEEKTTRGGETSGHGWRASAT